MAWLVPRASDPAAGERCLSLDRTGRRQVSRSAPKRRPGIRCCARRCSLASCRRLRRRARMPLPARWRSRNWQRLPGASAPTVPALQDRHNGAEIPRLHIPANAERRACSHCRRRPFRARSHQYAGERPGSGGTRNGGTCSGGAPRRDDQCNHRQRSVAPEFPHDPCRRPRLVASAAADRHQLGHRGGEITLVGKGICFDTGGLDIKPSSSMLLMKKDMGGAAARLRSRT